VLNARGRLHVGQEERIATKLTTLRTDVKSLRLKGDTTMSFEDEHSTTVIAASLLVLHSDLVTALSSLKKHNCAWSEVSLAHSTSDDAHER